jgi:diguanylate cyclase (GGDEF)-like protein/PAS domain S-box-containing protein
MTTFSASHHDGGAYLPRMTWLVVLLAIAFTAGALLLPMSAIELLAVPLIVAGAYFGGLRGGLLTAIWSMLVTSAAYVLTPSARSGDYVVSLLAYAAVGIGLGWGVDGFVAQRTRLKQAVERLEEAQQQLSASQQRYRLLFEGGNDAVTLHGLDAHGEPTRFVAVNDAAGSRLGYTREEMLGLTPRAIDAAQVPGQLTRVMEQLQSEGSAVYESARKTRDGRLVPVEISSSLTAVDGEALVLSISRDISERKRVERELETLSLLDELTGLFNRRGFNVMLGERRKYARRTGAPQVVLYADLDGLKDINDTHGHARGDRALVGVADALRRAFRETDLIARLGGDEFCVVAEADASADPAVLSSRLDEALVAAGVEPGVHLSMSYGAVVTDWRGLEDPDALLSRADSLMYEAKRAKQAERRDDPPQEMAGGA